MGTLITLADGSAIELADGSLLEIPEGLIYDVIDAGAKGAAQMPPENRTYSVLAPGVKALATTNLVMHPSEEIYFFINWAAVLNTGESLQTAEWDPSPEATLSGSSRLDFYIDGQQTAVKLTGGTLGQNIGWLGTIHTIDLNGRSQTRQQTITIQLREKTITPVLKLDPEEALYFVIDWSLVLNSTVTEQIQTVSWVQPPEASVDGQINQDTLFSAAESAIKLTGGEIDADYRWPHTVNTLDVNGRTQKRNYIVIIQVRAK